MHRCGHCKSLKPVYEKLAQAYARESNCVVAALDGDKYGDFMSRFNIQGFPTIKFFPKGGNKTPMDYQGGRDLSSLVKYLNEFCGTHRDEKGVLTGNVSSAIMLIYKAGRVGKLDALAAEFVSNTENRQEILAKAQKEVTKTKDAT